LSAEVEAGAVDDSPWSTRAHALTHDECVELITRLANLPPPGVSASLPEYIDMTQQRHGAWPRRPDPLTSDELEEMGDRLHERLYRRKHVEAGAIVLTADDRELTGASRDLNGRGRTTIHLAEGTQAIEVWMRPHGNGEDVLLTSCLLTGLVTTREVILEDHLRVSFKITAADDAESSWICGVTIEPSATTVGWREELRDWWGQRVGARRAPQRRFLVSACAAAVIMSAVWMWMHVRAPGAPVVKQSAQVMERRIVPAPASPRLADRLPRSRVTTPTSPTVAPSLPARPTVTSLAQVRHIYVDKTAISDDPDLNREFRQAQMDGLNHAGPAKAVTTKALADAIVEFDSTYRSQRTVSARLRGSNDRVLWQSPMIQLSEHPSREEAQRVAEKLQQALTAALVKASAATRDR
jgi:hypothetical protein